MRFLLKTAGPRWVLLYLLAFVVSAPLGLAWAVASDEEIDPHPLTATAELSAPQESSVRVTIRLQLVEPYHAYADRFSLKVVEPSNARIEDLQIYPTVEFTDPQTRKTKLGVSGQATVSARLVLGPKESIDQPFQLQLGYQACTKKHCLFPQTLVLAASFRSSVGEKEQAPKSADDGLNKYISIEDQLQHGVLAALAFMFVAGFLTSFTPCIYPMIPITLAVLGAKAHSRRRDSFLLSVAYVLGIATMYSTLGVIAASTGRLFGSMLSSVWVTGSFAVLFAVTGLSMLGVYDLQLPRWLRNLHAQHQPKQDRFGAFVAGLVAGIVASPCVGPVLVGALAFIAKTQNIWLGFLLLFFFALGMGVLFLALGLSRELIRYLPRSGIWMEAVKKFFGVMLFGMALYYARFGSSEAVFIILCGLSAVLIASLLGAFSPFKSRTGQAFRGLLWVILAVGLFLCVRGVSQWLGSPVQMEQKKAGESSLPWKPWSADLLQKAKAAQRPVIIDFSADWCEACVELERKTFPQPEVQALKSRFEFLKVDATEMNDTVREAMKTYRVLGLPTLIFIDSKGLVRADLTLTGFEKSESFASRMAALSP